MQRARHRVIIEGVDGSGKTVLINRLLREVPNLEMVRNEKQDIQNFSEWWPSIVDREDNGNMIIHDRFFYSELVYGPVIRGKISETASDVLIHNILWFLRSTAFLVYARPHSSSIKHSVLVEDQMKGVHEHLDRLIEGYDVLMQGEKTWYPHRFFHYDWTDPTAYDRLVSELEEYRKTEWPR